MKRLLFSLKSFTGGLCGLLNVKAPGYGAQVTGVFTRNTELKPFEYYRGL